MGNIQRIAAALLLLSTSAAWAAPAQVLIIRHAEKPETGDDLSPEGYKRAEALVPYFESNPAVTRYGTPVAIYAMKPADDGSGDESRRPIETVTPLAQSLGLRIQANYTRKELQPLVDEIMSTPAYDGKMVLICWEHKKIDTLAKDFGVRPKPDAWPDEVFDKVWELDFSAKDGKLTNFREFSQDVMPGDT